MRVILATPFLAVLMFIPANAMAQSAPGCGPANVKFDVKTEKSQRRAPTAEAGKALVFFLQDDLKFEGAPRPTTRFGIDGTWVGATHANSYFYFSVAPGEHDVCASWESLGTIGLSIFQPRRTIAATHFTAEAGRSYYFQAKDILIRDSQNAVLSGPEVKIVPVDFDEAQAIMNSFSFSLSHPKK